MVIGTYVLIILRINKQEKPLELTLKRVYLIPNFYVNIVLGPLIRQVGF